jgi:hypothetical protein
MKQKAQIWGIDLIVGVIIFSIGILIFFIYSVNQTSESKENLEELSYDGEIILDSLLSEGYPDNWDSMNVIKIGILNNEKINETKLMKFYNLTKTDYPKTKSIFGSRYDYYFFMNENITINSEEVSGIGKPWFDLNNITSVNLIKITRFTVYREKPATVYLYVWE